VTSGVHIARTNGRFAATVTPFRFSSVHSVRYERTSGSGNTPSPRPHIDIKATPWELRLDLQQDAVGESRLRPGTATWRAGWNIRVLVDSGLFGPLCETWCHSQNRKYITYCLLSSSDDQAAVTGNRYMVLYRKFGEYWTYGFRDMRADRQANKQTDIWTRWL